LPEEISIQKREMKERIRKIAEEIKDLHAESLEDIEALRIKYLSKKGEVSMLFNEFREVPNDLKKEVGQMLNKLKNETQEAISELKEKFEELNLSNDKLDLTRSAEPIELGTRHPLSIVKNEIVEIFSRLGFVVAEGPEIEDDWHVFSALNFPPEHPARDMQDTFFIARNPDVLLRTHTSSVQTRTMTSQKPPIRVLCPGRVYRNEAISYRAHCFFHQVEGLYIDKNVSFADLKQALLYFAKEMFGEETQIRLRPSYFPFTEPSAEMDISCNLCGGKGCPFCKGTGWVEILGCGMVDPNVLESCGIDSKEYTGYAFGMGVERMMGVLQELDNDEKAINIKVAIISLSNACKLQALKIAEKFRENNFEVFIDYKNNNLKPQFKLCDRENVEYILILGDDEINNNTIRVKNVVSNTQEDINIADLTKYFNLKEEENYAYKH
jgi:phenylalanyl-tRNA synthetase alpha chain